MPNSGPAGPSLLRRAWYGWKALRLPWRRQHLVGADLMGNTYWEFKDSINASRQRRIMKHANQRSLYAQGNAGFADVRISPQWHQWLRHTRDEPPSIQEQQYEISRQEMMKVLAAQADERWKSIPSYLDAPRAATPKEPAEATGQGVLSAVEGNEELAKSTKGSDVGKAAKKEPAPWEKAGSARGAPSENFQPQSWSPGVVSRR